MAGRSMTAHQQSRNRWGEGAAPTGGFAEPTKWPAEAKAPCGQERESRGAEENE